MLLHHSLAWGLHIALMHISSTTSRNAHTPAARHTTAAHSSRCFEDCVSSLPHCGLQLSLQVIGSVAVPVGQMLGLSMDSAATKIVLAAQRDLHVHVVPIQLSCRMSTGGQSSPRRGGSPQKAHPWGGEVIGCDGILDRHLLIQTHRMVLECRLSSILL